MNIIVAQLKKDLAFCRIQFWCWLGFVALECVHFFGHMHSSALLDLVTGPVSLPILLVLLLTLIARVIHADLLVEPNAFWRTRPIAKSALLTEKVLCIAVLTVGTAMGVAASGLFRPAARGLEDVSSGLVVFLIGFVAFAAVTENVTRMVLTYVAEAWGAQILAGLLVLVQRHAAAAINGQVDYSWASHSSTFTITNQRWSFASGQPGAFHHSGLYVAGFICAILCQYLTLRTNVSRLILFVTFFAAALLAHT